MPPKRPAAAIPAGRGRVRGVARARGALRRPAAAAEVEEDRERGVAELFAEGAAVTPEGLPNLAGAAGQFLAFEGSYWLGAAQVAGELIEVVKDEDFYEARIVVKGTTNERLLKWASGLERPVLRVHLCSARCGAERTADDLFHGQVVRKIEESKKLPWMSCLEKVVSDELGKLRDAVDAEKKDDKEKKSEKSSSSTSRKDKRKKKKKKKEKDKEKKRAQDKKKDLLEEREKLEDHRPTFKGQASLKAVFGGTGLDPSAEERRRLRRKVRSSLKKSKRKDSQSSSGSSSPESDSLSNEGLFPETRKVRSVAKKVPGALAAQALEEMKENLLTSSGQVWGQDFGGAVPPLTVHYFRAVLRAKMSGGLARECLSLSYLIDLALQGRVAEALDVGLQRLKSLELTAEGSDFRISQRLELAPPDTEAMASNVERREALQEAREEHKLKTQSGKGNDWWRSDSWKGGKADVKGKKGDGKDKTKGGDRWEKKGGDPSYEDKKKEKRK